MTDDDKDLKNSTEHKEDDRVLKLKDNQKYKGILDESLESYTEQPDFGSTGDGVDADSSNNTKIEISEPWSIKRVKILGSVWFSMVIFLLIGNILIHFYLGIYVSEGISKDEATAQFNKTFANTINEFTPFEKFLSLSTEVSDSDYSSFLQAVNSLNSYFPREQFDITTRFTEDGFHFANQGIYYNQPD